jgi:adenylate kinase
MVQEHGRIRTVLVLGAPGSGKGTQGRVLGAVPGFFHLACGDVFRSLDTASELGSTFLQYSSQGKLVPDQFTIQLWLDHIRGREQTGDFKPDEEILVLDGIPRNRAQAEIMSDYIDVICLVFLEAKNQDQLVERLRRRALHENRLDDANESVIRQRLLEYESQTAPLLDYYASDVISRVDAGKRPIDVLRDVVESVQKAVPAG